MINSRKVIWAFKLEQLIVDLDHTDVSMYIQREKEENQRSSKNKDTIRTWKVF